MPKSDRWRVVRTDCRKSPVLEVLAEGVGDIHIGMSVAEELREELGPEVGVAVEWLYNLHGTKWERYAYYLTDQQKDIVAELDRRDRDRRAKEQAERIEKKLKEQKRQRQKKKERKFEDRFEERRRKRETFTKWAD